ncbi:MAG: YebC/PmpR family DNA-binding transcriptional regulator [bacterium]|nr:YebC/PmpR family DNA-binding transcriptional regulator [bacterium]
MSGHSKWSQIKHKKAVTDKKRGQLFSKLSKLISLATKKGANSETNVELKNAIDQARSFDVPNDNIEGAIKRASDKSAVQLEELNIEAVGPGGIALRVKAITDNKNRTIAEIKHIFNEHNSKLVPPGSISWMFGQSRFSSSEKPRLENRGSSMPSASGQVLITEPEIQNQIGKLFEALDNNDDVEDVISNLEQI